MIGKSVGHLEDIKNKIKICEYPCLHIELYIMSSLEASHSDD